MKYLKRFNEEISSNFMDKFIKAEIERRIELAEKEKQGIKIIGPCSPNQNTKKAVMRVFCKTWEVIVAQMLLVGSN